MPYECQSDALQVTTRSRMGTDPTVNHCGSDRWLGSKWLLSYTERRAERAVRPRPSKH